MADRVKFTAHIAGRQFDKPDGSCTDCGLPLEGKECEGETQSVLAADLETVVGRTAGHPGICCDCYDEGFGMPVASRTRPRPDDA